MAKYKIYKNQHSDKTIKVKNGYSWLTFLFGPFYLLFKMMIGKAILLFVLSFLAILITSPLGGIGGLVVAFLAGFKTNEWYASKLLNKGYKPINENSNNSSRSSEKRLLDNDLNKF
jgi:hypothetical protein